MDNIAINREDIVLEIYRNRSEMEAQIIMRGTGEVIDRIPVTWKARENKLDYLSVSKIQAYEQCPACFYKQYLAEETVTVDNGNYFTKFGTILHSVCEIMVSRYINYGIVSNVEQVLMDVWSENDLQGFTDYEQAKSLLIGYFNENPLDSRPDTPVMIEEEWRGELGGYTFGLMIDYVGIMKHDNSIGILRDYKTNRMPFTTADLDTSLQLRIYQLVLSRHYFQSVEKWIAGYDLFFHGWQRCKDWNNDDLKVAEEYVNTVGRQIENDNQWEERLNNYCCYRECRHTCKKYAEFMKNPDQLITPLVKYDGTNIELVNAQMDMMTAIEKTAKGRKEECSNILKAEIENLAKNNDKLVIDGKELTLFSNQTRSYRYHDTRNVLLTNGKLDILDDCLTIQKTKLDAKVKGLDPAIQLQLAGCCSSNYASPYIVKKKA